MVILQKMEVWIMSRTVESIGNNVICFDTTTFDADNWEELLVCLKTAISEHYPSFIKQENKWTGRENRIILENSFVSISISEYCGCGAVSVFANADYILAESWLIRNFSGIKKVISQYVTPLKRIATFSNGEAVYEKEI
jgi:hypothetical protein